MKQASASATATASSSLERCHKRAGRDDEGGDGPPSTKNNPTDSVTHPGLNNPQPPPQEQQEQQAQTDLPPKYGDQEYWEQRYKRLRQQDNGGNNTKTTTRTGSTTHYDKNDDTDGQEGVRTSRYTSAPRFSAGTKNMESNTMGEDQDGNKDDDDVPLDDEGNGEEESMKEVLEPLPYHAWYFSYQELRPLLIPLIFGDDENHEEDGNHQENQGDDGEDVKEDEKVRGGAKENEDGDDGDEDDGDIEELSDDNECIEFEQVDNDKDNDDDDEEEGPVDRGMGLVAEQGPIDVLEIGCGDVPLGVGLAQELWAWEQERTNTSTGAEAGAPSPDAQPVARHILCTDYSPAVIDQMQHDHRHLTMMSSSNSTKKDNSGDAMELSAGAKEEGGGGGTTNNNPSMDHGTQNSDNDNDDIRTINNNNNGNTPRDTTTTGLQLEFAVADACNLHFVPNQSRALILEKGTLDAMLSDPVHGLETCRQAVRECARILTVGGYIVLISYQNAHTPQGLEWLRQVIYEGLKTNKPTLSSSNNNHDDDDDEKQNSKTSQSITSPKDSISTVTTSAETINIPTVAIADPNTTPSNKVNQSYRWKIEVHGKDEASTLPERMDHDMERNDDHVDNDDDDKGIGGSVDKKKIREGPGPAVYVIHKEPLPRTSNSDTDNKKSAVFTRVENEEGNESARPSDYDDDDDGETIPIRFYSY